MELAGAKFNKVVCGITLQKPEYLNEVIKFLFSTSTSLFLCKIGLLLIELYLQKSWVNYCGAINASLFNIILFLLINIFY